MPLRLYMDVHVPAAITAGLRLRSLDVLTAQQDGRDTVRDEGLLLRATELSRLLFSQDDDLLRVAKVWQRQSQSLAGVLYAHQLSAGIGTLVRDLELVLKCCSVLEVANRVTYLPLS